MNFCPRCGARLTSKLEGGRERPACPAEGCGYFHFGDSSIGCGGVVMRGDKALLIQRGINPGRGTWQIPGGYAESDEEIVYAVEREVLEEAGITARVTDVVGLRHSIAGSIGGPSANLYVVFRLQPDSGEPHYDGEETIGAGYFSLEEMEGIEGVQSLSIWAIQRALVTPDGAGLTLDTGNVGSTRPGWSLFGVTG